MIKPSIRLQDLRWGIYAKKKANSTGTDGVGIGGTNPRCGTVRPESTTSLIGHINLGEKPAGQPNMGKPYVGLDVAGAGNVARGAGLRTTRKVWRNHRTLRCARQLSTLLEPGDTFACAYGTPMDLCPTSFIKMFPAMEVMRCGGDLRNLGGDGRTDITVLCPDGVVLFRLTGDQRAD